MALLEAHKNPDAYADRSSQTVNNPQKNKEVSTVLTSVGERGSQASSYEILDATTEAFRSGDEAEGGGPVTDSDVDPAGLSAMTRKLVNETLSVSLATPGCLLDTTTIGRPHYITESRKKNTDGSSASGATASRRTNPVPSSSVRPGQSLKQQSGRKSAIQGGASGDNSSQATANMELVVELRGKKQVLLEKEAEKILASRQLLRNLHIAERAVQQNAYHHKHLDYRDLPEGVISPLLSSALIDHTEQSSGSSLSIRKTTAESQSKEKSLRSATIGTKSRQRSTSSHRTSNHGESLSSVEGEEREREGETDQKSDTKTQSQVRLLYSYRNDQLVRGRAVTSMCWNCVNLDLLTVGYGNLENFSDSAKLGAAVDEELHGGLVLFWSLRNPDFPEKILRTPHAVTCLDFSKQTPSLLAVGLLSGDVLVYDMRRQREGDWGHPVESSMNIEGGHNDPVWQLTWVLKGSDRLETLVSISTDGNILEWNLKKGMIMSTLMQLKRNGVGDGWITRKAAGLCFDFLPSDPSSYVACTEDGNVHHCSIAYNEQYLGTFEKGGGGSCHDGPINRVAFSPHWPEVFLTCSSDWTMSLFHTKLKTALFSLHVTGEDHAITDLCWCPGNSTLFAAVTAMGRLQVWDLNTSSIDPVINLDTSVSEQQPVYSEKERETLTRGDLKSAQSDSRPVTAATAHQMFDDKGDPSSRVRDAGPVNKLLKNLNVPSSTKSLTCVKFGERNPALVVGDSHGVVSVYRLIHPVAVTHEGPLQQMERLRSAILKQTDPEKANRLMESMSRIKQTPTTLQTDELIT